MKRLFRERMIVVLLFVLILVGSVNSYRQFGTQIVAPIEHHSRKLAWRHVADVVIAGDSVVQSGVDPGVLGQAFPSQRVCNYAFGGNAYGETYLDAIEQVLDPQSDSRVVILGISPQLFLDTRLRSNPFMIEEDAAAKALPRSGSSDWQAVKLFFSPLHMQTLLHSLFPQRVSLPRIYHANGWCENNLPEGPGSVHLSQMENPPHVGHVDSQCVAELLVQVQQWRESGITVYGFRPCKSPEWARMDDHYYQFDPCSFCARFAQAGGIWLEAADAAYPSYDGCHLNSQGAGELSAQLARQIQMQLAIRNELSNFDLTYATATP